MENSVLKQYLEIISDAKIPKFLDEYLVCPSLLRLKKIGYFCGMDYASKSVYNFGEKVSRYDHSLFVSLITWKFTHDMKATLAALFHDISTPCFSHVIDYMNKDYEKQESTEEKTFEIINNDSYLLSCLEKDNISSLEISDFKRYSIVDLDRPMLCADRLDGVILTGLFWTRSISFSNVCDIVFDLELYINENGVNEIGFRSREIADLVVNVSSKIDLFCHSNEDNYMMELLAQITRRAIEIGLVSYDELFLFDEDEIFEKFKNSSDLELLNNLKLFMCIYLDDIPLIDMPKTKTRDLNPLVLGKRLK